MTLSNNAMLMTNTGYTLGANRQLVIGSGAVSQVDTGTVTLSALNPGFTGSCTLGAAGTLNLNAANAIGNAPALTVTLGTANATVANALGNGGVLTVGGGAATLTGAQNLASVSMSAGTLTITDTTNNLGDVILANSGLGSGTVTLSGGTLNLRANGDDTTAAQLLTYNNPLVVSGTATINADYQAATAATARHWHFPP